jgi:hypothetical protein
MTVPYTFATASGSLPLSQLDSNFAAVGASNNVSYTPSGTGAVATTVQTKLRESVSVLDFGADSTGVADSTAAFQAAVTTGKSVLVPAGTYKTNSAVTGTYRFITQGASFTGTVPVDTSYPAFGGVSNLIARGGNNCLVGISHNNLSANTTSFPTAVTAYSRNDNGGNASFGIYAQATQYATTGVVTNEIDSFNMTAAPSSALPPDRSIGTSQNVPVALTVAAGGSFASSIGIHLAKEGSSPQQFLCGIYINPDSCSNYGLFVDADASNGPTTAALIKYLASNTGLQIQASGTTVAGNASLKIVNTSGTPVFSIRQDGKINTGAAGVNTQTTIGVAGAAAVLPSNPTGYLQIVVGGLVKAIPYYEA